MARSIARFKHPVWIMAVSSNEETCQRLLFSAGVYPVYEPDHPQNWSAYVKDWLSRSTLEGNLVILTEGPSRAHPEANHRMEIIRLTPVKRGFPRRRTGRSANTRFLV
jgi:pyruvate kinase